MLARIKDWWDRFDATTDWKYWLNVIGTLIIIALLIYIALHLSGCTPY